MAYFEENDFHEPEMTPPTSDTPPEFPEQEPETPPEPAPEPAPEPEKPAFVPVYISSKGIETISEKVPGLGLVEYVRGDVNGVPFKVECDKQVSVEPHIAEALQPLIERQRSKR